MVLTTVTDITLQKEAEEIHRKNEQRFRKYIEAMPQMAFISDAQGNMIFFNKRWANYIGGMEDPKNWGWKDESIYHPDDLEEAVNKWNESFNTGKSYSFECRLRRYDGEYRWHLSKAEPIRDNKGNIEVWLGVKTDIQVQKKQKRNLEHKMN